MLLPPLAMIVRPPPRGRVLQTIGLKSAIGRTGPIPPLPEYSGAIFDCPWANFRPFCAVIVCFLDRVLGGVPWARRVLQVLGLLRTMGVLRVRGVGFGGTEGTEGAGGGGTHGTMGSYDTGVLRALGVLGVLGY